MAQQPTRRKSALSMKAEYYCSSEDEEEWQAEDPLISCVAFGWTEDGRCGFQREDGANVQDCPQPLPSFQLPPAKPVKLGKNKKPLPPTRPKWEPRYICKQASAGSRHSLFLMIDSSLDPPKEKTPGNEDEENEEEIDYDKVAIDRKRKRGRKVLITGLNQVGLCEEKGYDTPQEVPWDPSFDRVVEVTAGRGTSFLRTKNGHLYSFGNGRFGQLGLGDSSFAYYPHPRRLLGPLTRRVVLQVAVGAFHAIARTDDQEIYAWGRNDYGQLGLGLTLREQAGTEALSSPSKQSKQKKVEVPDFVASPLQVLLPAYARRFVVINVACGAQHSLALLEKPSPATQEQSNDSQRHKDRNASSSAATRGKASKAMLDSETQEADTNMINGLYVVRRFVFGWGDDRRGQLGAIDPFHEEDNTEEVDDTRHTTAEAQEIARGVRDTQKPNSSLNPEPRDTQIATQTRGGTSSPLRKTKKGCHVPQEHRDLTRCCRRLRISIETIVSGGHHVLALIALSGQVLSWGAGDYGQLGHGNQFDDPQPRLVNQLHHVTSIAAGLRHSMAVCAGAIDSVFCWGFNGWGELGLGDLSIRLQPTKVSALKHVKVRQVVAGERHSLVVLRHQVLCARDLPVLQPFFQVLYPPAANDQEPPPPPRPPQAQQRILMALKNQLRLQQPDLDANLLHDPALPLPHQPGEQARAIPNDVFETGLQYCLDTYVLPHDWRRKALEACFRVIVPPHHLQLNSVCLSCARNCLHRYRLVPYIRQRTTGLETCDCALSGRCVSRWSRIRATFDQMVVDKDRCLAPRQLRTLLKTLRAPFQVESSDVEAGLNALAEGQEDADVPRIRPVPFETWYRVYYDEPAQDTTANKAKDKANKAVTHGTTSAAASSAQKPKKGGSSNEDGKTKKVSPAKTKK